MALTSQGHTMAAMCISLGDYDNDGWLDLYISDFQRSSDHLWHNDGKGFFDEVSDQAGITRPTRDVLSFGGGFFDYEDRKSTRLNSSHDQISYAVFCLKKKKVLPITAAVVSAN